MPSGQNEHFPGFVARITRQKVQNGRIGYGRCNHNEQNQYQSDESREQIQRTDVHVPHFRIGVLVADTEAVFDADISEQSADIHKCAHSEGETIHKGNKFLRLFLLPGEKWEINFPLPLKIVDKV